MPMPRRIRVLMLATDFSPASASATEQAITLATQLGARLLVTSVVDASASRHEGYPERRVDQVRASHEANAQEIVERARRAGIEATFLVWEGDPGEVILNAAGAEGADLIVVGSRGLGQVGRLLLGSVSDHIVRHASVPVLVVRSEAESRRSVQ